MGKNWAIFQKSAKGQEAIATRSTALGPKLRSLLILIDGRRSFDELAKVAQGLGGDPEALMAQLESEGFIEPVSAQAMAETMPAALAPDPESEAADSGRPRVPLVQAQRFAARYLTDLMGPGAEAMCMRIEATRTPQEFRAAVRHVEKMLRDVMGPGQAARFVNEVENQRPT